MKVKIPMTIHLQGKGVEDGTILLEDLVPALQGFSSAYGKIASSHASELNHIVRVQSFKKGSFNIDFLTTIMSHGEEIALGATIISAMADGSSLGDKAYRAVDYILKLIKAKKHIKNEPYTQQINYNNSSVVIINNSNVEQTFPLDVYNLLKEKSIDSDLNKLVSIIDEENIDNLSITYTKENELVSEEVSAKDKKYFEIESKVVSETTFSWITCRLNSLTKSTNRGRAYLSDGSIVSFSLVSENPKEMYKFFIFEGWVRAYCKVKLDENLKPIELDVTKIEEVEARLPLE
jgi:hypothetical protein